MKDGQPFMLLSAQEERANLIKKGADWHVQNQILLAF